MLPQQLLSQTRDKRTDEGHSEVTWRGRTVPVRVEAVRLCLRSMADVEKGLEVVDSDEGKISVYETLLKQCIEAQEAMRESLPHDAVLFCFRLRVACVSCLVLCMFSLADSSTRGRHCRFVLCVCFHLLIYPLGGDTIVLYSVYVFTC